MPDTEICQSQRVLVLPALNLNEVSHLAMQRRRLQKHLREGRTMSLLPGTNVYSLVDLDRNHLVMQEAVMLFELLQGNLLVLDTRVRRGATHHLPPIQITFQLRQLRYRGNLTSLLPLIPLMHRHPMTAPLRLQVLTKAHRVSLPNPEILYLLQAHILTPPKSKLKDRKSTSNARPLQYATTMKRRCPIEIGIDRNPL